MLTNKYTLYKITNTLKYAFYADEDLFYLI